MYICYCPLRDLNWNKNIVLYCIGSRIPVNPSFYVYIILKELDTIASNHNSLKKIVKWKFDIKNIYPKYIKVYTDIDPTVDFVFPVNKIDRENSEKIVY